MHHVLKPRIPRAQWRNRDQAGLILTGVRGFTLLETLVAFMVLAIVMVVLLQVFSGGIKSRHKSDQHLYATFHARAKMEELMATAVSPGSYSGRFADGYHWQAEIMRLNEDLSAGQETDVERLSISVKVSWSEKGHRTGTELHSLKLVLPES